MNNTIKNLNRYIDCGKVVIVALLFLLGSEPTRGALIFISAVFLLVAAGELFLIMLRQHYIEEREAYLKQIELAVRLTSQTENDNQDDGSRAA